MKKLGLVVLLLCGYSVGATAGVQQFVIDFDTDSNRQDIVNGQVINNEYANLFGAGSGVYISAINNDSKSPVDLAVAFDSSLSGTRDSDLQGPFNAGPNFPNLPNGLTPGNILIIQENGYGCLSGVCGAPDDEGTRFSGKPTGVFTFDFDVPIFLQTIDFFDIEDPENGTGSNNEIILTDTLGATTIFHTPDTGGDNLYGQITFNTAGIVQIDIELRGSGAIDNLVGFRQIPDANTIPEPYTLLLFIFGLIAMGWMRQRQPSLQAQSTRINQPM